jgi:glycosyltransferase involved in cell wall biosynthesis
MFGFGRKKIYLVSDGAGWILDEVASQIQKRLVPEFNAFVDTKEEWRRSRNALVHFIERGWAWGDGVLDKIHPSANLIGLWWHGKLDSNEPGILSGLERVKKLHPRFSRIQVPTSIARKTMQEIGVPDEKVVFLPEGIDCKYFRPAASEQTKAEIRRQHSIPESAFVIGSFQKDGQGWSDGAEPKLIKGPDVLAEALEKIAKQIPVFALIPGPSRGYLQKRLAKAGIPSFNPGHIRVDGLAKLYHALDLYVSPSRDEGGPAGLMEAMASGVAVVSTRSGIAPDLFEDGKNGILVEVDDALGLAQACVELANDASKRARVAENGAKAIQELDWDVLIDRYIRELYLPVLGSQ